MSFFDQQAPPRVISDKRVVAWNNQALNTHDDADYKSKARRAQDAMGNASKVGSSNVTPPQVGSSSDRPSNINSFDSASTSTKPARGPLDSRNRPVWSGSPSTGATNFSMEAPIGLENQPQSSSAESPGLQGNDLGLPPHLRRRNMAPAEDIPQSFGKLSKRGTRAPPTMNAGTAAKSAKLASNFPCTYLDCTLGFAKEKSMKKHKEEDHHYCRLCDEDFPDFDGHLYHKLESDEHICCCICGEDFRSEGGRIRHERQESHATQQECKCVGCGLVFEKGSALIHHIYENNCRSNNLPRLINKETFRQQRAQAALHLDFMSHQPNNTSRLIADMQPEDDVSSIGGVRLEPQHLLDNQDPMEGPVEKLKEDSEEAKKDEADLIAFPENAQPTRRNSVLNSDFPTLGEAAMVKEKKKQKPMAEGLNALTLNDPSLSEWSKMLFAGVQSNAAAGQGTGTTMVDYRRAIIPGEGGEQHLIATDWDHKVFKRHNVDGHFHCPFTRCSMSSTDVDDIKRHLTSGVHQGTDQRCLKCLKHFKTVPALIAHMESNSERCKIKDTEQFGQILSVVSGGFLGVKGRSADGSIQICALNEEELEEQADDQRKLMAYEDPNYDWSL